MPDESKKNSVFLQNMATLADPENFQKYILGTKGNGQPRAVYDVLKDCTGIGKKSKKKKKKKKDDIPLSGMSFYMSVKGKKKKKKNNKKHWHVDGY